MSQENSLAVALVQTEPDPPGGLTYEATASSTSNIALSWTAHAAGSSATGGATILSYNLQMKVSGATDWTEVQGEDGAVSPASAWTPWRSCDIYERQLSCTDTVCWEYSAEH